MNAIVSGTAWTLLVVSDPKQADSLAISRAGLAIPLRARLDNHEDRLRAFPPASWGLVSSRSA